MKDGEKEVKRAWIKNNRRLNACASTSNGWEVPLWMADDLEEGAGNARVY